MEPAKLRTILRQVRATHVFYSADESKAAGDPTFVARLQRAQAAALQALGENGVPELRDAAQHRMLTSVELAAVGLYQALNLLGLAHGVAMTTRPLTEACPLEALMRSALANAQCFTLALIKAAEELLSTPDEQ